MSKKSRSGTDGIYTPKLWCFNYISFLNDGDTTGPSVSNMPSSDNQSSDHSCRYPAEEVLGEDHSDSEVYVSLSLSFLLRIFFFFFFLLHLAFAEYLFSENT